MVKIMSEEHTKPAQAESFGVFAAAAAATA